MRIVVGILAFAALANIALAQPFPTDPLPPDAKASGDAKIPITMSDKTEVLGAETSGVTSAPTPIALEQPIDPDAYICGPGDVFENNFWGQQNFRLKITVDLEGRTFISKVGYVTVS